MYASDLKLKLIIQTMNHLLLESKFVLRDMQTLSHKYFFGWMTPFMQLGYKRPITEKDVRKLDTWDETETLYSKFQKSWSVESQKPKPWLLGALCFSLGGRVNAKRRSILEWLHLSILNICWSGIGVLFEAQYFQNVMCFGFQLRSTLVAVVFRKSLRLTHESRRNFTSGKITNLMTTVAITLQQVCQQLNNLWSAPFRIIITIFLLYKQLGVASLIGSLMLVFMFPLQTQIISRMQKLNKEGLQRTVYRQAYWFNE